jgi:hypothetical protein
VLLRAARPVVMIFIAIDLLARPPRRAFFC